MAGAMPEHNLLTLDYWQDRWNHAEILWNGIQARRLRQRLTRRNTEIRCFWKREMLSV